ncbi:S1 family peptidase [Streptomyces alkaliterrae]|uniref:Serine protease n=1 Tax=Streptomyces alkaliterrae TaxID=2213162 RepID=A0A5P0YU59_9ACTN|nr:serine protease [Streptomyces alkaliterrae]MBB1253715.1 serine protease [Streptomyces alkaliterrae]MBB1257975.1 serine protease [Streptomyces alkaliterrae]MQS03157.1 trypsin-like serine protease [Streptomyces alkaliterrae]
MSFRFTTKAGKRLAAGGLASAAALSLVAATAPSAHAIIGGTEVSNDAYPFMAGVLYKGKGSALKRQFCGGSLVDASVVMTAAHCVEGEKAKDLQVVVGRTVLSAKQGQIRDVRKSAGKGDPGGIVIHPRYTKGNDAYDLAFLELARPVKGITPIKLPTQGTDALIRPGQKAVVTGWGNTDTELPNTPDRLRQVRVPILSHGECKVSYKEYNNRVNFCAGVEGRDSCQGDSGGPIFRNVPGRKAPIQIGVVSYGDGCGGQGAPGVYVSTSSDRLWKTLGESPEGKRLKKSLNRR